MTTSMQDLAKLHTWCWVLLWALDPYAKIGTSSSHAGDVIRLLEQLAKNCPTHSIFLCKQSPYSNWICPLSTCYSYCKKVKSLTKPFSIGLVLQWSCSCVFCRVWFSECFIPLKNHSRVTHVTSINWFHS